MSERRLVSIRRRVAPERRPEYDAAWSRLQQEATSRGARAWRFRAADQAELYIEFLEFKTAADPRAHPSVAHALRALESAFPEPPPTASALEEWRET